jgi:formate/nitrite transporter FocA (FNT family)
MSALPQPFEPPSDQPQEPTTLKHSGEQKQVEERVAISANVVHEAIRREGDDELQRSSSALAWSGLAAGLAMGFSLAAEGLLAAHLPETNWRPLISRLGYSVGFLMVILGRQQLFTENTLTAILPLLLRKNLQTLGSVLRLWTIVLLSNLIGAYLFALSIGKIAIFSPHVQEALISVSREGSGDSFWIAVARSVFAGWLIAMMVWLLPGAESSRVSVIMVVTYLIGLGNFHHIIAGSNKQFFLLVMGQGGWRSSLLHFFAPTLLGNVFGGVSLVAFLNHAQVVAGNEKKEEESD